MKLFHTHMHTYTLQALKVEQGPGTTIEDTRQQMLSTVQTQRRLTHKEHQDTNIPPPRQGHETVAETYIKSE